MTAAAIMLESDAANSTYTVTKPSTPNTTVEPAVTALAEPESDSASAVNVDAADPNALNPYIHLVRDQNITTIPSFTLECGETLTHVPVAYKTWGTLNAAKDNAIVVCHALSGSADVADWWGPLLGARRVFDPRRWFIVCCNVLGSPYGSASPVTINPATGTLYGAHFPRVSVRDDVRLHRRVLDQLGVASVAFAIGGSMGGMQVLEWGAQFGPAYVRHLVPMATAARHSAWCIAWGEAQRQAIFADPAYHAGEYSQDNPPRAGLAAARIQAMLTYRTRDSFQARFARRFTKGADRTQGDLSVMGVPHNDGLGHFAHATTGNKVTPGVFSAQSYLRYQGDKFVHRFDANCYVAITRKLDTHDLARPYDEDVDPDEAYTAALQRLTQPTLVLAVASDGLFTVAEHEELVAALPNGELGVIASPDGHDGFLLEFDQVGHAVDEFMRRVAPEYFADDLDGASESEVAAPTESSTFGEVDLTAW
ncbi:homoserine O-acetyltransferase [Allomyces macrogynus ATCC 38327]|uniref:Homoserine O-acetyltransferase n=1 Tax=Allomyces macrogynus (strain ATCC 38327) TaxID=578462 RepID=A0A0L0SQ64_ALLM3|nr:homoserine O-acetyltransferase [Allomyces macrogynus ATCC 38327]|eukprot:KNE64647.1 homoserine O-acetyltransferase [Allomyces macrogynus ATCC 38327]